jgi:hypothetical protein
MTGLYIKRHDKGVLMLAKTIAAATMGRSTTFVDAGRHDELPDCNIGKGSIIKQFIQKVAPARIQWDKCTVRAPDIASAGRYMLQTIEAPTYPRP